MIKFECDICGKDSVRDETYDQQYALQWEFRTGADVVFVLNITPDFYSGREHMCKACMLDSIEKMLRIVRPPTPLTNPPEEKPKGQVFPPTQAKTQDTVDIGAYIHKPDPDNPIKVEWDERIVAAFNQGYFSDRADSDVPGVRPTQDVPEPGPDVNPAPGIREDNLATRPYMALHADNLYYPHKYTEPCPQESCRYYLKSPKDYITEHGHE